MFSILLPSPPPTFFYPRHFIIEIVSLTQVSFTSNLCTYNHVASDYQTVITSYDSRYQKNINKVDHYELKIKGMFIQNSIQLT